MCFFSAEMVLSHLKSILQRDHISPLSRLAICNRPIHKHGTANLAEINWVLINEFIQRTGKHIIMTYVRYKASKMMPDRKSSINFRSRLEAFFFFLRIFFNNHFSFPSASLSSRIIMTVVLS